jgi:hypothetical protein
MSIKVSAEIKPININDELLVCTCFAIKEPIIENTLKHANNIPSHSTFKPASINLGCHNTLPDSYRIAKTIIMSMYE